MYILVPDSIVSILDSDEKVRHDNDEDDRNDEDVDDESAAAVAAMEETCPFPRANCTIRRDDDEEDATTERRSAEKEAMMMNLNVFQPVETWNCDNRFVTTVGDIQYVLVYR
jgi:hypothetical protein